MELIIIGLITAANFLILKVKAEQHRWADLTFDVFVLSVLSFLFSGTIKGLTIAMVSSFVVSVYLYFFPPDLKRIFSFIDTKFFTDKMDVFYKKFKKIVFLNNRQK